jgi:hypothetical protein
VEPFCAECVAHCARSQGGNLQRSYGRILNPVLMVWRLCSGIRQAALAGTSGSRRMDCLDRSWIRHANLSHEVFLQGLNVRNVGT